MATHSIFALTAGTDELVLALKAGAELVQKGHDVWLYGSDETAEAAQLEGIPHHEVDAEDVAGCIEAIAEESDSVLVVDLLPTVSALSRSKGALDRVRKIEKLVALDPWDIGEGGRVLDAAGALRELPIGTMLTSKRLVPSPTCGVSASAFRSTPSKPDGDDAARRTRARRALGIEERERLLVVTTNAMQVEHAHGEAVMKQLARRAPKLLAEHLARLDGVRVLHMGPAPLPWEDTLEGRYTWMVPPGTRHLHNRFAACDALLVLDSASWSIAWAACWGVPAMAIINSFEVKGAKDAPKVLFSITERTRAWLGESVPLPKFRVCPLGLWQTLEPPPATDLPYVPLELLDEASFTDSCRALLFDESERARALRDTATVVEEAASLPTAAELWEKLASS